MAKGTRATKTKTTKKPKPKRKAKPKRKLPLRDPRWLRDEEALRLLTLRTGNESLAAFDLRQAKMDGRVRSMRRHLSEGRENKRELVPAEHWTEPPLAANLYRYPPDLRSIRGWVYYAWRPDLERELLGAASPTDDDAAHADDGDLSRQRPGTKPFDDWPKHVAWEVVKQAQDGKRMPTVRELLEFCQNKFGREPDSKQIYDLLRGLRVLFG
jgi:hypothetical protein